MKHLSKPSRSGFGALLAVALALGTGGAFTYSAFTANTSNSGNTLQAAASFDNLQFASGTYAGNGSDDRSISVGFQPDLVIVKASQSQVAVARTSTMTGDVSKALATNLNPTTNHIQSLDASGFTVGSHTRVNSGSDTYFWAAFKAASGVLRVGTYTGNGTGQSISGVGFSPEYVATMSAGNDRAVQRFASMTSTFQFDADTGNAARITSLDADGFSVGTAVEANKIATVYHYIAFNDLSGSIKSGSYSGNGSDDQGVTGVGFQPDYVMVRANDTVTARAGRHRPASLSGDSTLHFSATANAGNAIQALQADGFQRGTDATVNASGVTYHYMAFKNTAGG